MKFKLSESDFKEISNECDISALTVRKWYKNTLSVRPSTQDKIIESWFKVCKKRALNIDAEIDKMDAFIARLESIKSTYKETKSHLTKQISTISEL